jgi:hypothetical protein
MKKSPAMTDRRPPIEIAAELRCVLTLDFRGLSETEAHACADVRLHVG